MQNVQGTHTTPLRTSQWRASLSAVSGVPLSIFNFQEKFWKQNVYYQKIENWLGKTPFGYLGEVRCVPPRRGFPWEFMRRNFAGKILPYEPSRKPFPWGYATRGRGGYEGRKGGKHCGLKRHRRGKCIWTCINTYFHIWSTICWQKEKMLVCAPRVHFRIYVWFSLSVPHLRW